MKKTIKIVASVLVGVICVTVLVALGYVLYVILDYSRIEDGLGLEVQTNPNQTVCAGVSYKAMTFNIGFGAYDHEFSFFMDYSNDLDGTPHTGVYGKGRSKEAVSTNTNGAADIIFEEKCDFYLLQEVDINSTRSYKINQFEKITKKLTDIYANTFAVNYDSAFLYYPLHDPIGKSLSGLATYSRFKIDSATRIQLPLDTGFAKFFDLDRCLSVNRLPVDNGKQFVLINIHMSAYDEGGLIRQQQLALLNSLLIEEYQKGNYVVVGGDFNHDIAQTLNKFATTELVPDWVFELNSSDLADGFSFAAADNVGTCRSCGVPYVRNQNYTVVLDGFIVSDNVTVKNVTNLDKDFKFSDHNPAVLTFELQR